MMQVRCILARLMALQRRRGITRCLKLDPRLVLWGLKRCCLERLYLSVRRDGGALDVLACVRTTGVEVLEIAIALILDDRVRLNPVIDCLVYLALRRIFC